ncbi:MAG: IPT/TIG domain-containing protein, partial [Blastocatellia bacterium]
SDILNAGSASVTVATPPNALGLGGGTSNALPFNIVNPTPTITALIPNSIAAGSPSFTMTINGRGFIAGSQVRWNGAGRQTTFISSTQLSAQIVAGDVQSVGAATVTVANPVPGGGISNAVTFTITTQPLPPPALQTIAATAVAQGSRQVRLTLVGTNFRTGARVVIGQSGSNPALAPAGDIIIESMTRLSETTMQALVSVSPQARLETRAVDVVNADSTSTAPRGSNTTQALRVTAGSSLGAPVQITSLVVTYPRTGSVIAQGETVFAEAVLSGAGTGIVIGYWLWDGAVFDQFTLNLTGGQRQPLKTSRSLPTVFIGSHRLELKIVSPNLIQSPTITVVITPGTWKQIRALAPSSGRGYAPERPPTLHWTIVPGAAKYQVGFSTQPFFRSIPKWHDVTNTGWTVPSEVWNALPEGELFWTVRAVEMSGATRQPALMRRIQRVASGALIPTPAVTGASHSIPTMLLQWKELKSPLAVQPANSPTTPILYRLTILREGVVLRRFLTAQPKQDLHSLAGQLAAGESYDCQVEAFTAKGRFVMAGARQSFTAPAAKKIEDTSWRLMFALPVTTNSAEKVSGLPARRYPDLASLNLPLAEFAVGKSTTGSTGNTGNVFGQERSHEFDSDFIREYPRDPRVPRGSNLTPDSAINPGEQIATHIPTSGQTVKESRPTISADLKTGAAPSEINLLVDDTDVTAVSQIAANKISYQPAIPLSNGLHQVALKAAEQATTWNFTVAATATPDDPTEKTPGTDAEAEPAATAETPAEADPNAAGDAAPNEFKSEITSNTEAVSRQEEEKNDLSVSAQGTYTKGPWKAEMNGSGLVNSVFGPRPNHLFGRWNDYVFKFTRDFGLMQAKPTPVTADAQAGAQAQPAPPPAGPKFGFDLSFGMIAPQLHLNSEFVSTGFPREAVEAALRTPIGKFSYYLNTNDKGQGEGIGFGFRQQVQSASYEMPSLNVFADPEKVKFRLMWMSARDIGGDALRIGFDENGLPLTQTDAFATPRAGDSFGGLLTIKLNQSWQWNSEYALTSNNVNRLSPESQRNFGRAWRSGVTGTWRKANIALAYRDVSPNFAIPATANLTQLGVSDRRGLDASISRDTKAGTFSTTYQLLESDFRYADRAHLALHNVGLNWTKMFGQTTTVTLGTSEAKTLTSNRGVPELTGEADQNRFGVNAAVNHTITSETKGSLTLALTGARNWFRDRVNLNANNITSTVGINAGWSPKPVFQLQANYNVNWIAGEKFSVGNSVMTTAYIQPVFNWASTGWSIMPLISINQMKTRLGSGEFTSNMLMTQTGGRISYQLPGRLRFNTFSFEGSAARTHDALNRTTMMTPRFLVLWTMVRPSKPAPEPVEKVAPAPATNE